MSRWAEEKALVAEGTEVFQTSSIEVERTHDCNGAEEYHNEYHHYTDTVRYWIVGNLAELVRAKAGLPDGTPVYFIETEEECGYSEYTQETDYGFVLEAGDFRLEFKPQDYGLPGWGSQNGLMQLLNWLGEGLPDE